PPRGGPQRGDEYYAISNFSSSSWQRADETALRLEKTVKLAQINSTIDKRVHFVDSCSLSDATVRPPPDSRSVIQRQVGRQNRVRAGAGELSVGRASQNAP